MTARNAMRAVVRAFGQEFGKSSKRTNPWPLCLTCRHRVPPPLCPSCGDCDPCCLKCTTCGSCVMGCPGHRQEDQK